MNTRELLASGREFAKKDQIDLALNAYSEGIKQATPGDETATGHCYAFRGKIYQQKKQDALAIDDFTKALALHSLPKDKGPILIALGTSHFNLDAFKTAIEKYQEALKTDLPDDIIARCFKYLGFAYEMMGDGKHAIENFTQAIQLFEGMESIPKEAYPNDAYFHRGNVYQKMGDEKAALDDYKKACAIPKLMNYFDSFERGKVYLNLKFYSNAIIDFRRARDKANNNVEKIKCLYHLAVAYQQQGDHYFEAEYPFSEEYRQAKKLFREVIEKDVTKDTIFKARSHLAIGEIYQKQGCYKKAIAEFTKAIDLFDEKPHETANCYFLRAIAYTKRNKDKLASRDFYRAITHFTDPIDKAKVYFARAQFYKTRLKIISALESVRQALKLYPENHPLKKDAEYLTANLLQIIGSSDSHAFAIRLLTKLIPQFENASDQAKCYFDRAKSQAESGNHAAAIEDFKLAILVDAKHAIVIAKQFDEKQLRWIIREYFDFYRDCIKPVLAKDENQLRFILKIEKQLEKQSNASKQGMLNFGTFARLSFKTHEQIAYEKTREIIARDLQSANRLNPVR